MKNHCYPSDSVFVNWLSKNIRTYFKKTLPLIRIKLDDALLVAGGFTGFTLVGSTIVTEFESENGDFVLFANSKVTVIDSLTYDITPVASDIVSLQIGLHTIRGRVTVNGTDFGFEILKDFEMKQGLQTG